jgi:hypothetical protein
MDDESRSAEETERELEHHGDKVEKDIEKTREDWKRKQEDSAVPGAVSDTLTGSEDQPDAGSDEQRVPDGPG